MLGDSILRLKYRYWQYYAVVIQVHHARPAVPVVFVWLQIARVDKEYLRTGYEHLDDRQALKSDCVPGLGVNTL